MDEQNVSRASRRVESLLDSGEKSHLSDFLRQESTNKIESQGATPSNYDIFAVRRNDQIGDEIFGPKRLHVGNYSEEVLYGAAGSSVLRFRSAIQAVATISDRTATLDPEDVEYGHQAAIFWAEIGRLKEFLGATPVISEIVSEFRTAQFQFQGKDTPPSAMKTMSLAFRIICNAKRLDSSLVDQVVETLEGGGIDSLAVDVLRDLHG